MKCLRNVKLYSFRFFLPPSNQIGDRFTPEEDRGSNEGRQHKDHRVSGIISAIFDSPPPVPIWAGGIKIALSTQRKIDEGVSRLLWRLELLLYIFSLQMFLAECISTGNSFQLYFSFHTKTRGEGGGNNNKLLPKFPPTLSITLYFYCKLDAPPPPLPVLRKFVYFAIAQFGRKSKNQSTVFCSQFLRQTERRHYLSICLVITPEFYGRV